MAGHMYWAVQLCCAHFSADRDGHKDLLNVTSSYVERCPLPRRWLLPTKSTSVLQARGGDPALAGTPGGCFPCKRDVKTPITQNNPISGADWFVVEGSELTWWVTDLLEKEQPPLSIMRSWWWIILGESWGKGMKGLLTPAIALPPMWSLFCAGSSLWVKGKYVLLKHFGFYMWCNLDCVWSLLVPISLLQKKRNNNAAEIVVRVCYLLGGMWCSYWFFPHVRMHLGLFLFANTLLHLCSFPVGPQLQVTLQFIYIWCDLFSPLSLQAVLPSSGLSNWPWVSCPWLCQTCASLLAVLCMLSSVTPCTCFSGGFLCFMSLACWSQMLCSCWGDVAVMDGVDGAEQWGCH